MNYYKILHVTSYISELALYIITTPARALCLEKKPQKVVRRQTAVRTFYKSAPAFAVLAVASVPPMSIAKYPGLCKIVRIMTHAW